jgi:hypothetical protein
MLWDSMGQFGRSREIPRVQALSRRERGGRGSKWKGARRPVSRVLSAPLRALDGHSSGTRVAARLTRPTRGTGRERPCVTAEAAAGSPYSVLLPVGFTLPPLSPGARCALTAPFHPCSWPPFPAGRSGLFSVALSLGSPPPAVSRHRVPVEPGLSSTAARASAAAVQPSGRAVIGRVDGWGQGRRVKSRVPA